MSPEPPALSPTQKRALAKLTDKWLSPYDLKESIATLHALYVKGYAEERKEVGSMFFPRTSTHYRKPVLAKVTR